MMNLLLNFLCLFACLLVVEYVMVRIQGRRYVGTCTNQTYGGMAHLDLILHKWFGKVSGTLKISGEIYGGGELAGAIQGRQILFTTHASYCKTTWFGCIKGKTITGTYLSVLEDGSTPKGIWTVAR